jgi:hypothetical protein
MPSIGRNEPCPCGSGRKFKRCCGTTREQAWEQEGELRQAEQALGQLAAIASWFPSARPCCDSFDGWSEGLCACHATAALVEEGVAVLPAEERARILERGRLAAPHVWQRARDRERAERSLLAGAVTAGLRERCEVDELRLALLEGGLEPGDDAADILAFVLDAPDLWSIREAITLDQELAALGDEQDEDAYARAWDSTVERTTARLLTDEHRLRLARMVARLEARLPDGESSAASEAIRAACAAFGSDAPVRADLAALLLADAASIVPRITSAFAA